MSAAPSTLWPPNKKFEPIALGGAVDPDGDGVVLRVTGVVQDEPAGDVCPSARIGPGGTLEIWSERIGNGNGRIYTVSVKGSDPAGAECSGELRLCVPHDQGGGACVEDDVSYDSMSCP